MNRLPPNMTRRLAVFSLCGNYRYWLKRELGSGTGRVLWIMMNPSHAGAEKNDATTTLTSNLSRAHGFAEHAQVNLSAQIEPDSTLLDGASGADDPLNMRAIKSGLKATHLKVTIQTMAVNQKLNAQTE